MTEFLSASWWQGISGIAACIALAIMIVSEVRKRRSGHSHEAMPVPKRAGLDKDGLSSNERGGLPFLEVLGFIVSIIVLLVIYELSKSFGVYIWLLPILGLGIIFWRSEEGLWYWVLELLKIIFKVMLIFIAIVVGILIISALLQKTP